MFQDSMGYRPLETKQRLAGLKQQRTNSQSSRQASGSEAPKQPPGFRQRASQKEAAVQAPKSRQAASSAPARKGIGSKQQRQAAKHGGQNSSGQGRQPGTHLKQRHAFSAKPQATARKKAARKRAS